MLLIKFDCNYADEFNMSGFKLVSHDEFYAFLHRVKEYFKENKTLEIGFGSNESFILESENGLTDCFTVTSIFEHEENVLLNLFENAECGYFPPIEELCFLDDDFD